MSWIPSLNGITGAHAENTWENKDRNKQSQVDHNVNFHSRHERFKHEDILRHLEEGEREMYFTIIKTSC